MINKKLIIKEKRSNKYLSLTLGGALLLFSSAVPWNSTFAQANGKIYNQNYQKTTLRDVIIDLQKKSGSDISFTESLGLKNISIAKFDTKNESLEQVLRRLLTPYGIQVKKTDNGFVLARQTQQAGRSISGKVVDPSGMPVSGATLNLKRANTKSKSDDKGAFLLHSIFPSDTLSVHFMGFKAVDTLVTNERAGDLVIRLETGLARELDEVVVVGYGVQKKVNLTGSVAVVDGKRLQDRPVNNVSQSLYGTVSGLTIAYGNNGFEPGAAPSVQIRGQGKPYVLIDGTAGDINTIDPNTVESVSILKDAAASAIYGARAPYGVLLITTKSGKANQKPQVDFSMNGGPTTIIDKPKMVDSYTFARAMNQMHDNQGVARLFSESTIDRIIAYIDDPTLPETVPDANNPRKWSTYQFSNGNNDWIDIHYGNGQRMQENLSVKGGSKDMSYFLSLGHASEKGVLKMVDDKYKRYNFQGKIDANITDWWKISSNTRLTNAVRDRPIYNGEGEYGMIIHQILRTHPEVFLKSPNGYYSQLSRVPQMQAGYQKLTNNTLVQRLATEISPLKNWKINADYSIDYQIFDYAGVNQVAYEDEVDGTLVPIALTVPSYIQKKKSNTTYKALNIYTTYNLDLGTDHHFTALAGFQNEISKLDSMSGLRREIIVPDIPSFTTATGEMQVGDGLTHWSTLGYFARLNYNYADKYLIEANVRYDGTSKFSRGRRWGAFPSVSVGWVISKELFWQPLLDYIPFMKLRGSWGKLGNQNVASYQDLALLGVQSNLGWLIDGIRPAYTTAPNLVNRYLTWESSRSMNTAIEMGFFQNRLQAEFEYYQRLTYDRLGPAQALPAVLGATIPRKNNSELKTKGWDFSLRWNGKIGSDFNYSVAANVFDYKNIITKYTNPTGILTTDYIGKDDGEIWGYETAGLIKTKERADEINASGYQKFINGQAWQTGDVEYRDLNGDGLINNGKNTINDHGDLKIIGNSTRRYQYGLNLTANYKNVDIAVFIQGTGKRDLWLDGNVFWGFRAWNQSSLFPHHMDYYRDTEGDRYSGLGINTEAYFPRPYSNTTQDSKNKQMQTRYLQNGAYARLKNLQIGYTIPPLMLQKIGLKRARIYFSGENIYTLSKLPSGFDPETAMLGQYGDGKGMFSQAIWAFGINISL